MPSTPKKNRIFLIQFLCYFFLYAESIPPTLDQVELLILKKKWVEAIAGLQQVTSSDKAQPKWSQLVLSSVSKMASEKVNSGDLIQALEFAEAYEKTFPHLQRDESFLEMKDGIYAKGVIDCLKHSNPQECMKASQLYLQKGLHAKEATHTLAKYFLDAKRCREGLELIMGDITIGNRFCLETAFKECYSTLLKDRKPSSEEMKNLSRAARRCQW